MYVHAQFESKRGTPAEARSNSTLIIFTAL